VSKLPPGYGGQKKPVGAISKIGAVSTNRTVAQAPSPAVTTGSAETQAFIDTYFTKVPVLGQPTEIIYNGDRQWAKVTLTLETAGPVAIGNMASITPVLSGKGQLLETDTPLTFYIAKGTKLYIAAAGINRIKRVIEAVPWLETLTGLMGALAGMPVPTNAVRSKI
jgi:hypothetical protein